MYARTTTMRGDPQAVDALVAVVGDEVMPGLMEMDGCIGLSLLVDRDAGRAVATSAWESQDAMRASAERVRPLRERATEAFAAEAEVQEWEIAVMHRARDTGDGACARLTWTQGDPADMDRMMDGVKMSLMPRLEQMPGFCSFSLLVDRDSGRSVGTVSFADRSALEATRDSARQVREEFSGALRRDVVDVAEMDVLLAHLRVPETV